jgi:hypothetical protein
MFAFAVSGVCILTAPLLVIFIVRILYQRVSFGQGQLRDFSKKRFTQRNEDFSRRRKGTQRTQRKLKIIIKLRVLCVFVRVFSNNPFTAGLVLKPSWWEMGSFDKGDFTTS